MASYTGTYQAFYFSDGSKRSAIPPLEMTVSDGAGDSVFTNNENLTVTITAGGSFTGTFAGTTVVGGVTMVIVKSEGGSYYLIGGTEQVAYNTFPSTYSGLSVNSNTFTVCFLAGTAIATLSGFRPIERLAIGDRILTADGRVAPVRWVGVQTVVAAFADPLLNFPIRVAAGALGQNLPVRDLLVSPDHALFLEGVLVQAGALVNGTTIVRETAMPERFTYYHVELEDHSLILAEGVPAETFLDTVTRRRFDNFADYEARYGEQQAVIAEMHLPRIKSARQLPAALRARIVDANASPQAA